MADKFCGTGSNVSVPKPGDPSNNSELTAIGYAGNIKVIWTWPNINPHAVAHVRVFRSNRNKENTANLIGISQGNYYRDWLEKNEEKKTFYYWIQIVSIQGTEGPMIGPAWAKSKAYIDEIIKDLTGKIDDGVLAQSLKGKLDRIELNKLGIDQELIDRAAEDDALAAALDYTIAFTENTKAEMEAGFLAQTSENEAVIQSIDTMKASVGDDIAAAIQTEREARVTQIGDVETSFANETNRIQSWIDDDFAGIEQSFETSINKIDGKVEDIGALYTMKLETNGLIGGFGVYNDGSEVEAGFDVDRFWIGRTSEDKKKPFIVEDSKVYIDEALINTLTFGKLTDEQGTFIVQNGRLRADYIETNRLVVSSNNVTGLGSLATQNSVNINKVIGAGSLASKSKINYDSDVNNKPEINVIKIGANAYKETQKPSAYAAHHKVGQLIFELSGDNSWPDSYGGVITYWYSTQRATQICFGNGEDKEFLRYTRPNIYPNWTSWIQKEVFSSSDVDALKTVNGPRQAGADKTSNNTSNDTAKVGGTNASAVRDGANNGNAAKSRVDGWTYRNTTEINGGHIRTGTIKADKIQVGGSGGLGTLAGKNGVNYSEVGGTKPHKNADVTSSNTSADTAKVDGETARNVKNRANNGNTAKGRTDNWKYPGNATFIDGGKIRADEAWIRRAFIKEAQVDTLQIAGRAVTIPVATQTKGTHEVTSGSWTTIDSVTIPEMFGGSRHIVLKYTYHTPNYSRTRIRLMRGGKQLHLKDESTQNIARGGIEIIPILDSGGGSNTIELQARATSAPYTKISDRYLLVMDVKR